MSVCLKNDHKPSQIFVYRLERVLAVDILGRADF